MAHSPSACLPATHISKIANVQYLNKWYNTLTRIHMKSLSQSRRAPVTSSGKCEQAALLVQRQSLDNAPKLAHGLVLRTEAALVARGRLQGVKVQVRQATNQQLQLLIAQQA